MKKIVISLLVLVLVLVGVVLIKTLTYPFTPEKKNVASNPVYPMDVDAVKHLAGGIQIPTVSVGELGDFDYASFDSLKVYLKETYPLVFEKTEIFEVNRNGLIFRLKGMDSSLLPILFLSHQDVVEPGIAPVKNKNAGIIFQPNDAPIPGVSKIADQWEYPPFSGAVKDGRIYGRGTLDMKGMLFSLMEAFTRILKSDQTLKRDVYLAFGYDEEVGGKKGAMHIAQYFKDKGLQFDAVYDEGGAVLEKGSVPGINSDIALIGVAEKGFLSTKITVKGLGGHSSTPPLHTAIGKASVIMQRLEENQMKPMIIPIMEEFLNNIGGGMPFMNRMAIANQWLLKPVLLSQLEKDNSTNALIRTTTALTMMKGSDGTNVLSPEVSFVVNFRLLPGNTVEDVKAHIAKATKGFDVSIEEIDFTRNASSVSTTDTKAYKVLEKVINQVYPSAIVSPYLTFGGTDSYKYQIVCKNIYRFNPFLVSSYEQASIHGTNEYITIANYMRLINFFNIMMVDYDK